MDSQRILVVDDEPDVVTMIERLLTSEKFEVICAYDGISALDLAATEQPDLVLLDIMMPMMSGYEVCEQLKGNPATKHIPVLCLSSGHSIEARGRTRKVGAATLLDKPFVAAELVAQIRQHLPTQEEETGAN
jgi:DNA-binding response OmpR family regulator